MVREYERRRKTGTGRRISRRLFVVAAVCVLIRIISAVPEMELPELTENTAKAILSMELSGAGEKMSLGELALMTELPGYIRYDKTEAEPEEPQDPEQEPSGREPVKDIPETKPPEDEKEPPDTPPETDPPVDTTITGEGGGYDAAAEGIYLKNKTDYEIDVEGLLKEPLEFSAKSGAQVLVIHTHGSEAYTPDGEDIYVPSDPSRTEDKNYNVVRVGDELCEVLTERGITVIHDRELYDYPSYSGSYNRALESINKYLAENPDIKVIIDLHRDALEAADGTVYKTVADIGDTPSAQVMLISGTNFSGLNHPNWQKNLSFALKIQAEMVEKYPTLARPLCISEYRYNQGATTGSLIAEVGCNGNTLQEAITAARYFGDCLAGVLLGE